MITFLKKGLLTTVQDLGRTGYQRFGMPVCGAMDPFALELGNILVGNLRGEAALEATVLGPTIRFDTTEIFAVTGGDFAPTLNGEPIEINRAYRAAAGDTLALPLAKSVLASRVETATPGQLAFLADLFRAENESRERSRRHERYDTYHSGHRHAQCFFHSYPSRCFTLI